MLLNTRMLLLLLESLQPQVPGGRGGVVGWRTVHTGQPGNTSANRGYQDVTLTSPRLTNLVLVVAEEPITAYHAALVHLESFSLRQWPQTEHLTKHFVHLASTLNTMSRLKYFILKVNTLLTSEC